jgi:hypothetical protein
MILLKSTARREFMILRRRLEEIPYELQMPVVRVGISVEGDKRGAGNVRCRDPHPERAVAPFG